MHAHINDLFPWLYYSNRFDILRKICGIAKTRIESKIDSKTVLVYCHLVSEETARNSRQQSLKVLISARAGKKTFMFIV